MAHVGKDFPTLIVHDLSLNWTYRTSPPYRMRLVTGPASSGALTTPWRSQDVLSTPPIVDYGTSSVQYDFINPVSSTRVIRITWKLIAPTPPTIPVNNLWIKLDTEFRVGSTVYATNTDQIRSGDLFGPSPFNFYIMNIWATSINRALVDAQYNLNFHAARWSDVPSYRPRKLDPVT